MKNLVLFALLFSLGASAQTPGTHEYKVAIADGLIEAPATNPTQIPDQYTFLKTETTCQPDSIGCIIPIDFDVWERVPFVDGTICSGNNGWSSDDCSSAEIPLAFEYSVCGETFNSLWVNTNGNITFDGPNDVFTSEGIPATTAIMVAPFWADVDLGGACGQVWILNTPTYFVATWLEVGYFSTNCDLLNTFQVVITDGIDPIVGDGNNTAFFFCDMNWTTGDASDGINGFGGAPASVGIDSGVTDAFAIIGNFDEPGSVYDGPLGENDGVDFLDNKFYLFDSENCSIESSCSIFELVVEPTPCDGDSYDLQISFIPAGVGPNGFIVEVNGDFLGPFAYGDLGELTTVVIEDLTGFGQSNMAVSVFDLDSNSCVTDCVFDAPTCVAVDCESFAGTMPVGPQFACDGASVSSVTSGQILDTDDVLNYALHTSATTTPGDILDVNSTGQFSIGNAATNTALYISAIVGNDNGDGSVDLGDPCLSVAAGTEVVFLSPVEIQIVEQCDNSIGELSLTVSATGGLPGFNQAGAYTFSGLPGTNAITVDYGAQALISLGTFDGQQYAATANDSNGCSSTFTSDPVDCVKLPIVLSAFEGFAREGGNLLSWTTESELDNDFFSVEYSTNGNDFTELRIVDGAGTSLVENNYEYFHANAPIGISYYRLTQVDFNNTFTRSDIINVNREEAASSIADFTISNPVLEFMSVEFPTVTSGSINVYDISGKLVYADRFENQLQMNLAFGNLSEGVYLIQLLSSGNSTVRKFLKR